MNERTIPISDEERGVLDLENRKTSAEAGLQSASEAKKRIEADIERIEGDIEAAKDIVKKTNQEIVSANEKLLEVKNLISTEKQNLEEVRISTADELQKAKADIEALVLKRDNLVNEISSADKTHEETKVSQTAELKDIEIKKVELETEIKGLTISKEEIISRTKAADEIFTSVNEAIEKKKEEKNTFVVLVGSLVTESENQKGIIKNNTVIISQQDSEKENIKREIDGWNDKLGKKKEEYKVLESKAFAILKREEALNSKESFIKSRFEKAGILYE